MSETQPTTWLILFVWRLPIMSKRMSAISRSSARAASFLVSSWGRFSQTRDSRHDALSATSSGPTVLDTARTRTSSGFLPDLVAASATPCENGLATLDEESARSSPCLHSPSQNLDPRTRTITPVKTGIPIILCQER